MEVILTPYVHTTTIAYQIGCRNIITILDGEP